MIHSYAPDSDGATGQMIIRGPEVKHLIKVLRLGPGDTLVVSDGQDRDYLCEITESSPDFVLLKVVSDVLPSAEPSRFITLYQGLPKGDKMDYIIEKSVELGLCRLVPVEMARSVVRFDADKKDKKRQRWQLKAESAAKQSGRGRIPTVEKVHSLSEALERAAEEDYLLVAYESAEDMAHTRSLLDAVPAGTRVGFFIGPEGGFTAEEIEKLEAAGGRIITLGPRILRTETAGPALLAMCTLLWE